MTSFIEELWSSIFTPGPSSTLLLATNATFAGLQVLLFALLIATYSIHFIVLSFLSGSLWWLINWFAREVRETQAREEEKARQREKVIEKGKSKPAEDTRTPGALDSTESDTETESLAGSRRLKASNPVQPAGTSTGKQEALSEEEELRKRRSHGESSGYVSTDSEWEKVDDKNA